MKNLKRALAVLVVATMMISTVAFASFSDVTGTNNVANAVNVGVGLKLFKGYDDNTFKPEGDITRAEFAAIVVRMLGQEAQADGAKGATSFTDVKADSWASGYINIVTRLGVVNGYGDGTFGPEDKVTYEQAIKMIIVALGYTPAIGSAGYPVGYLTKAGELGITSGVAGSNGVPANRGTVAQLVFNSLDVPVMTQDGYGTDISYVINDGYNNTTRKTIMSEYLDVVKLQVTVDSYDAVTSTSKNDNDVQVTILNNYNTKYDSEFAEKSEMPLDAGTSNVGDLVGSKAFVYVSYDENSSDTPVVVFATKDTAKTDEITVKSADLEAVTTSAGITTVEYWANETDRKTTKITYGTDVKFYMNGVRIETPDLMKVYGSVSFAKFGTGSEDYDTVFITSYVNFVVDSVSERNYRVSSKNGVPAITFDPDDSSVKATLVDTKGTELKWADLKENDILSCKIVTGTKEVIIATLVTDKVTGKVTEVDTADNVKYTIDGKVYETDPEMGLLKLEDEGTFFLDIMGNICYADTTSIINENYAYIFKASYDATSIDGRTEVKLFTKKGEFVTLKTASKIKLDGVSNVDTAVLTTAVNKIEAGQFITYDVNSSNEITKIDRASSLTGKIDQDVFAKYAGPIAVSEYAEAAKTLTAGTLSKVYLTDKTIVMVAYGTDEDNYEVLNVASLADEQQFANVSLFNVNADREVGAVLVNASVTLESSTTGIAAITAKSTGTNADGDTVDKIKVLQNGEVKTLSSSADYSIASEVGASIIPVLNTKGEIKDVTVLAVPNTTTNTVAFTATSAGKVVYTYGKVINRNRMTLTLKDGATEADVVVPGTANVYIYDERLSTSNRTAVGGVADFDADLDITTNKTTYDTDVDSVYAITREYDGKIVDVMIYIFEKTIN